MEYLDDEYIMSKVRLDVEKYYDKKYCNYEYKILQMYIYIKDYIHMLKTDQITNLDDRYHHA